MTGARRMMAASCVVGLLVGCLIGAGGAPALAASSPYAPLPWPAELHEFAVALGQLHQEGKFAEALDVCQQGYAAATDYEQRAFLLRCIGKTYERDMAFDQAIYYYRQVIEQYPESGLQVSWAKRDLAVSYMHRGSLGSLDQDTRLAKQVLEDFVQLYPEHQVIDECSLRLAKCNDMLGNHEIALAQYLATVEHYPTKRYARDCLKNAITLQQKFGRWDDAIASARRYLQVYAADDAEDAADVQLTLGYSLAARGDLAGAALEFENMVAHYPASRDDCAMALYQKANCEKALGGLGAARLTLERLVRDYPESYLSVRAKQGLEELP